MIQGDFLSCSLRVRENSPPCTSALLGLRVATSCYVCRKKFDHPQDDSVAQYQNCHLAVDR